MALSSLFFFFIFSSSSLVVTISYSKYPAPGEPLYPPPPVGPCLDDQKKLLLDLKGDLIFDASISKKLVTWNRAYDCCQWNGVGCDEGGHVIGLYLRGEGISGGIGESSSLFRLTHLLELDLSLNYFTTPHIPNQFHRLPNLTFLDLSHVGLMGPIPSTLANLTNILYLYLIGNSFTSPIPSFHMCSKLMYVSLRYNNLKGSLSHFHFEGLTNLYFLDLSENSLSGTIPHHLFTLPSIQLLFLSNNQFSGQIKEFPIVNVSNLYNLDLSSNRIGGPIPNSFFQLQSLTNLELSYNLFNGTFHLQKIESLPCLSVLALSYNNLSVETANMNSSSYGSPQLTKKRMSSCKSYLPGKTANTNSSSYGLPQLFSLDLASCNLYDFPNLTKQHFLFGLDLSNNHIVGEIPSWIWRSPMSHLNLSLNLLTDLQKPYNIPVSLERLDLHSNQLRCEFPMLPQADEFHRLLPQPTHQPSPPYALYSPPGVNHPYIPSTIFFLSNNSFTGVIPSSVCTASPFQVLDLSFNNLSGTIPPCLLENNIALQVLGLRGNNFSGVFPDQFPSECGLISFDVSCNNLSGKFPESLANCEELVVMNVGNNNFDDSFPCPLPLSLHVLVLGSNRFHGDLTCHQSWPELQIMDISSNNFSGTLDSLDLSSWRGMMLESHPHTRPNRSDSDFLNVNRFYRDEVTLTIKGIEVKLVKIWPDFTSIDLSCNNFEGDIPYAIGNLTSLYLLNLSHNALTSSIPKSLGSLTEIGSLDLSANHLTGRIPEELAKLTFLSILNVSYNDLTGVIPTGPQFQTFPTDSFEGNIGLCGFPLDKSCSDTHGSGETPSKSKDEDEIEWEYMFVALGYVVGLGSIAWTLLCCISFRERYFEKIEEVVDEIFYQRARRRRRERLIRRRAERRQVRRHHDE